VDGITPCQAAGPDEAMLGTFEASLERCLAQPGFLDRFYQAFLASSPKVSEKFAHTDFERQKRALHGSFQLMLRAAREDGHGAPDFLDELARRHGVSQLAVGAELYDLWLDSLLATVEDADPLHSPAVARAWEGVMGIGIRYLCSRFND